LVWLSGWSAPVVLFGRIIGFGTWR
jgi:hypothetical protein